MRQIIKAPHHLSVIQNNMTVGKSVIPGMILCTYAHGTGFKRMTNIIKSTFFGECVKILFNKETSSLEGNKLYEFEECTHKKMLSNECLTCNKFSNYLTDELEFEDDFIQIDVTSLSLIENQRYANWHSRCVVEDDKDDFKENQLLAIEQFTKELNINDEQECLGTSIEN